MAPDGLDALAVRDKVEKFLNAARTGNIDLFKKLALQIGDGKGLAQTAMDVLDANKRGALHFAAREGQTDMCKYLVEELMLDVNAKDEDGETPLVHAAMQGHTATANYLLQKGAEPAIASEMGITALHHAAGLGDIELMKSFLSKGVSVDLQSHAGPPLLWAAGNSQEDSVKLLLEQNANPNAESDDGVTPLLGAVAAGSLRCVELLVNAGANANISAGGSTPLHIAAYNGSPDMVKTLLEAGGDPNAVDEEGLKPIQVAAGVGNREAVALLFPVTPQIQGVLEWNVDGLIEYTKSQAEKSQEKAPKESNKPIEPTLPKKNLPEVSPEAKKKASEAKANGQDSFGRKDYATAVDAYTQAIDFDPTDATLLSNRSLCWLRLGQAAQALADAKACRELRPDWPKACYREGAALRLMQKFEDAANAFYDGVRLDPENMELVAAFREAVEAGKRCHDATSKVSSDPSS
ncbi:unnamed protein product [Cuscuta campestris]|uniref:Serine/threonine-protein kinase BSK1-like TPR repeats domain-containing protein n=1 Tax=Cuscuta campestris TaxID=132261 RepID=A0A484KQM6_9ASTE|nr:unnamed protein product [Cuscuta campestris]